MDSHKNAAYSLVATAPSPASSGTSLVVTAGEGGRFPAVPFNATVWATGAQPVFAAGGTTGGNFEIVRVTARTTDTLTITRAQESTTARTIVVGDQIAATITALTLTDIEGMTVGGDLTGTLPNPTIAASVVTNAKMANMAAKTVKMRHTNSTGAPEDTTMANLWTDLSGQAAADVAMNSNKLTGLAAATGIGDAVRYEQSSAGLLAAKASLISASAANTPSVLAVGTDWVDSLVPDSSQTTGLRWAKPRSGLLPTGAIAESFDRALISSSANLITGQMRLVAIDLPSGVVITSITFVSGATALALGTSPHFWVALYSSALAAPLRQSTDNTAAVWGANTALTTTLSSTFTTTYSGLHYIGVMCAQTGGTIPNVVISTGSATANTIAPIRSSTAGSGLAATAPTSPTPTAVGGVVWGYVS